jgi:predicted lipid carrier protein YhbT
MKAAVGITPPFLPEWILTRMVRGVRERKVGILDRLGQHAGAVIAIAPNDLPIVFRVQASAAEPVTMIRRGDVYSWDARITAPFFSLLAMLHGVEDGDALFFSREVMIEGDTSAVLAFRNALDAEEIDLTEEVLASVGLNGPAGHVMRSALAAIGRKTGVPVTRATVTA